MKKILAVLVFVLLAACLVAPKFIASNYEEKVSQLVTNLNTAPGYQVTMESLEDTWFTSKKVVHLAYDLASIEPSLSGKKIEVDLILDAHYGPILLSANGLLGLFELHAYYAGDTLRDSLNWPADQAFYDASVVMNLTGKIDVVDQIPAFDMADGNFTFSGYHGKGAFTDQGIDYRSQVNQVNLDKPYEKMSLTNTQLTINIRNGVEALSSGGLYDGDIAFGFEQLTLGSQDKPTELNIQGAKVLVSSLLDQTSQLGKIINHYSVDKVSNAEFNADNLSFAVEITNLNNQFFLDYNTFLNSFLSEDDASAEEINLALIGFFTDKIEELLSHNPELNITDLSGHLAEGSFKATVNSRLKDMAGPLSIEQLMDQNFWLWHLILNGNLQADESLITSLGERYLAQQMRTTVDSPQVKQQVQILLNNFIKQGLIQREKDKLMTEISIADGQGKINNFPFPLM
ncbi:DUF945 family protein [Marinomonas sp. THO17]|uniref:YdgA family protein n=1 Tax=Marinomonas sp. THO17 TaxID=3149048 RepID=UPI00336C2A65